MRRILNNVLCKALCLALLACATLALSGGAMAAEGPLVLVLPFQVNAGPELPNASQDLPQMIADQLKQNGMRAVPMETARLLQRTSGESIDLATARELGRKAGARMVIYGKFNQLGQGFSAAGGGAAVIGRARDPAARDHRTRPAPPARDHRATACARVRAPSLRLAFSTWV